MKAKGTGLAALVAVALHAGSAAWADEDERLQARVAKIDEKLIKALGGLAREYDKAKDPEATHFFAECFLGFGGKDSQVAAIKGGYEIDLYVGKLRGGTVIKAVNPIKRELQGPAKEYKKVFDELYAAARAGGISEFRKKILHDVAVKYEIAQSAHEYVQAIQRFNELRRALGLRAILWDFEASRKLILAGCYMGETADYKSKEWIDNKSGEAPRQDNVFWGEVVEFAKRTCSRLLQPDIAGIADSLRCSALVREDLMNLDARKLWLGRWAEGRKLPHITLYCIPAVEFRGDIPTPSKRYTTDIPLTEHPGWVDTEETATVGGRKVPYVRYPYDGERDAPRKFDEEYGWAESESKFLEKAGVPIMLRIFSRHAMEEASATLKDSLGRDVPCRLYTDQDKRVQFHVPWPTILALPERELERDRKHTITMKCTLDGTPFEKTWSFTTRSK